MLAEFVQTLAKMAREAHALEVREIKGDARSVLVRHGDTLADRKVPPPDRRHTLAGIGGIVRAATDKSIAPAPEIYHAHQAITLVLDREDRRARVVMPLEPTQRFQQIAELRGGRPFSPREAVKLLRYKLAGTGAEDLVGHLRRIDFEESERTGVGSKHGRESFGKAVEMAVVQADQIPEEFILEVPVYQNPGLRAFRASIQMGLFLDLPKKAVEIGPLADEIELAINSAQAYVRETLTQGLPEVPIFQGSFD